MPGRSFVSGTIILMFAGFIVRILGFVYRIYLSNLIGAEGMGLFQLIAPVYSLIILTLTSGVSIAVSKTVAAELARNHPANLKRITTCALVVVTFCGLLVSALIYANADFIVNVILKDSRTYYSVLLLVPCIPLISASSALKGYFYGIQEVAPTAVSQVVEQLVRISLVMATAGWLASLGLEYACAVATAGMAAGEIANLIVLYAVYSCKKKGDQGKRPFLGLKRKRHILKELLVISLPVSFNRFITSIMSAVEMILIPRRLLAGGMDYQDSIEEYGRLYGMAMPLLFFPSLVTSSLATTLVPAISEAISLRNFKMANYRISRSIQFTFVLGFIFMSLFLAFPNEIGSMAYRKEKIGGMLYALSFACIFLYLQQTLLGILNGLGKQGVSLRNSIAGSVIRIGFVYFCVPLYGIGGYVWGLVTSSACVCLLNLFTVVSTTGMAVDVRNWIIKPGIAAVFMFLGGRYIYYFFEIFRLGSILTTALTITAYVVSAVAMMTVTGTLDREELMKLAGFKRSRKNTKD